MDNQKIDMFLMTKSKYFEGHELPYIRQRLQEMDDSEWSKIHMLEFKDPTILLIVSLLAGALGVDRFMLGETGMGIGKLITCGGLGIWTIIDWFLIMGATREKNLIKLESAIY
jgi:TM2 domain-containing membrane protein YozV